MSLKIGRCAPRACWYALLPLAIALSPRSDGANGTWTKLTNNAPGAAGTAIVMSDGRVFISNNSSDCSQWMILTPDITGNYANGTWTTTPDMSLARLYFASVVLPSGKLWVLGGEYSGAAGGCGLSETLSNTGQIYDPVTNSWTAITTYPHTDFGDDPAILIPAGASGSVRILAGDIFATSPEIYDINGNSWSTAGSKVYGDERDDEEGFSDLGNGKILTYDLFHTVDQGNGNGYAELYTPNSGAGTWAQISPADGGATGTLPVLSSSALGFELGPQLRLQDGRTIVFGANQFNAIYTPSTNSWAAGPQTLGTANTCGTGLNAMGADDAPAAEVPTGHVIFAADCGPSLGTFSAPTHMFEFDPVAGTITDITSTLPAAFQAELASTGSYTVRLTVLPTGQVLATDEDFDLYLYTPSGSAPLSMRPVVSGFVSVSPLTLGGLQLNGQSAGSHYGDDVMMDSDFPIIHFIASDGSTTYWGKTTNWSKFSPGNNGFETVQVTLPASMPTGNYTMIVSGAGIQSIPQAVHLVNNVGKVSGSAVP